MGGNSSNGSFIPKRGPVKQRQHTATRQVYLFTVISYVGLFGAVIASIGVFLYNAYVDRLLDQEIAALNQEIASFNNDDMQEVLSYNLLLSRAEYRFNHAISMTSLLRSIEDATVTTAQIESLSVERETADAYAVTAVMATDIFDSTIFQRGVLERNDTIAAVVVENVMTQTEGGGGAESGNGGEVNPEDQFVQFDVLLTFDVESLPLTATPGLAPPVPEEEVPVSPVASSTEAASSSAIIEESV